jgi:hypothetical protein
MDFGLLFSRSWQILWRHKFMWLLGFLPGITHVVSALLQHWFTNYLRQDLLPVLAKTSPGELLYGSQTSLIEDLAAEFFRGDVLVITFIWLFLALVVYWLIFTWAESSIIAASLHVEKEQPITLKQSLSIGWKFVGRFIAIDAFVFLPWFVVALAAMVLALIVLVGAVGMTTQGSTMESVMSVVVVGFGCVSLLGCLLVPLGFLTMQFRTLAFRDTAVFGGTIRESVRHTWQVVRANLATVIILVAIMWGVDYLFGLVTSLISVPIGAATAVSIFSGSGSIGGTLTNLLSLLVTVLLAIPKAILFVFIGIAWTLAYLDLAEETE